MKKTLLIFTLLFFITSVTAISQPSVSSRFFEKDIESKILGESVSTWLLLPEDYDSTAIYGVMYVLDADGHFSYMGNYAD